jgi:MbtH protein
MDRAEQDDDRLYKVVMNHEEQYSIWPVEGKNPLGWTDAGKRGTKAECLEHINQTWTDMRPLSLRKKMEEMAWGPADTSADRSGDSSPWPSDEG